MAMSRLIGILTICGVISLSAMMPRVALAQECITPDQIAEAVERGQGTFVVHELRDNDATRWTAMWNAIPPETALMADQIIIVAKRGAPAVFVWMLLDGCAVKGFVAPAGPIMEMTDRALGVEA